jgi:predicted transposase YbfD/YdcC
VLDTITDPRQRRGIRYPLQSVLAVAVCATLAGARSFSGIYEWAADQSYELRKRLRCWHGRAPSERTFRRVLLSIDAQQIDTKVGQWLAGLRSLPGHALALDGKTLRGSRDGKDGRGVHLLAAVVHGSGEVVAQTPVDGKTNEITRVAPLLGELDISGAVITADALLTQREIARHIVEDKHADYVFTVKDNHPELRKDISDLFVLQEREAKRRQRAGNQPPETEAFPPSVRDGR